MNRQRLVFFYFFFVIVLLFRQCETSIRGKKTISDGKLLLNRFTSSIDSNGYYRLSNYDFKCLRQLKICSSTGWTLRFKLRLNSFRMAERERKFLLLSTGAHEPHGDGLAISLYQSKNTSYLEFGLKEFRNDQFAYYWQIEVDLEMGQWIDVVTMVKKQPTNNSRHHQMSLFFDGFLYKETQVENYTELFIFEYENIHSKFVTIYGNDSGLVQFRDLTYYERLLTTEEISNGNVFRLSVSHNIIVFFSQIRCGLNGVFEK